MKSMEQIGPDGAGTVTAACVWHGGRADVRVDGASLQLLRAMPWFRGGRDVAVMLVGERSDGSRIRGRTGCWRKMTNRLDKLPPVMQCGCRGWTTCGRTPESPPRRCLMR